MICVQCSLKPQYKMAWTDEDQKNFQRKQQLVLWQLVAQLVRLRLRAGVFWPSKFVTNFSFRVSGGSIPDWGGGFSPLIWYRFLDWFSEYQRFSLRNPDCNPPTTPIVRIKAHILHLQNFSYLQKKYCTTTSFCYLSLSVTVSVQ